MIIGICNEKGGSGKTTIAINLAFFLAQQKNVLLIDSDSQKSTQTWANIRSHNDKPHIFNSICKEGKSLRDELVLSKNKYDYVVVDTAGRDNIEMRITMAYADIIIIPTIPSQLDISVLLHLFNVLKECQITNTHVKTYILINRVNTNIHVKNDFFRLKEFVEKKLQELDIENTYVMQSCIFERQIHKNYIAEGMSVLETQDKKGKNEFIEFFKELQF